MMACARSLSGRSSRFTDPVYLDGDMHQFFMDT